MSALTKIVVTVTVVAVLLMASVRLQAIRERLYPETSVEDATLYLTSGTAARRLAFASNTLAADIYWIRAIQYYGGIKRGLAAEVPGLAPPPALAADPSASYDLLYPLLDLTTTLDPRFNIAYQFGAVFLAESYPNGPGRPDLAEELLAKGLRERPDKWEYMQDIGFVHYWYKHDYQGAAAWFERAANVPGAPWWLQSLAATTLAEGGDRRSSRQMWEAILQSAEIDWLRQDAERRLLQLRALDEIDRWQAAVDDHQKRTGQPPPDWRTLLGARVPVDPVGVPFDLRAGRVSMSRSSPLWPLPSEPQAAAGRPPA